MKKRIFLSLVLCFCSLSLGAPRTVTPRGSLGADEVETIKIFEDVSKSVVHITTIAYQRSWSSRNVLEVPQGTGTGFIWDDRGHIVTNYHVIKDANLATVTLSNQSTFKAKFVGAAPEKDLAVLRLDVPSGKLKPIAIGESHNLKVGQKTLVIGNPFGLDQSLTTGIISALGREIDSAIETPIKDVIQTDAAINPGNSGGPVLDSAGRLIGVATAIYSPSGAYAGIGFAIPIDVVNWVVPELIDHGKITRPDLGITLVSDMIARYLQVDEGALIMDVDKNGPSAKAGLRGTQKRADGTYLLGDIILAVNDAKVESARDVFAKILAYKVGDVVDLKIVRGSKTMTVKVSLQRAR